MLPVAAGLVERDFVDDKILWVGFDLACDTGHIGSKAGEMVNNHGL